MNKEEILNQVQAIPELSITVQNQEIIVVVERDGLLITLTIPFDVKELYFEAKDQISGTRIDDWRDYYDKLSEIDFKEDLNYFLNIMKNYHFRIDNSGERIEYMNKEWQYMFGKVPDCWLKQNK